ncbi:MFS transporter [Cognatishimia activa]|uniref:Putative MFS-type transporter YcaD n=1 Tax=Cognatishimia activa TaxID=1715691 RepID=A0A0P1IYR7_9RHOB|nr:MFS transporter [Cognatishimia activa]CUJ37382.1 putative MFS-type transporter YcaD [Cognatishimia activa]CUK26970.1 putative MFS-type transporter YcaD [Cognatishimia activa]
MIQFLSGAWALLLGILLLMLGNGMHGTLLGLRGEIEGFSTAEMSFVMSAYFVGFLGGSKLTPEMIRRVGHVRVFAALASFISACLILFPVVSDPWAWVVLRIIIGFCFSGVYVTAEGWLNNAASNENRGQALSFYMIVQMVGIIAAQAVLLLGDPSGFVLFVIPSVLISISFAPILLSITPTPAFEQTNNMSFRDLWRVSPLGFVGIFLLGGMFAAQFGMAAVFGTTAGLTIPQITMFVASIYIGAMLTQFPIGWISDRVDRRFLILVVSLVSVVGGIAGMLSLDNFALMLVSGFILGGTANPLYSLLLAHTNDFVSLEEMAGTSGSLLFINGLGAISGPLVIGWLMTQFGPVSYFGYMVGLMAILAAYAAYRTAQRPAPSVDDTASYTPIAPTSSPVAFEVAQIVAEEALESENER